MKYLILITGFLFNIYIFSQAQESKKEELFNDAEFFFWSGEYEEALFYYLQLIKLDADNANFNFKVGESYLNIPGKEVLGIPYFEKSLDNLTEKKEYKRKSLEETRAPLHALFYLGNAYRINNDLDKALEVYDRFVNSPWYEGEYNLTVVENEIKATERAKIIKDSPASILQHNFGSPINSEMAEFSPVISGDGNTLIFIRSLKFYDALFYSKLEDNVWSDPVNISPLIGSDGDLYPTGLSFDGKTLLLVKKQDNNDDIYVSRIGSKTWSKAVPLSENVNTRNNESHASFSDDGKKIFLSSDRRGGEGGFDIWVSELLNGVWSKPENLGKDINTEFDEVTPYSVNNGQTLYFSSKGHYNMGGFDIFYSNMSGNKWKTPINEGFPINTTGDNLFFVPVEKGNKAIMSLQKPDGFGLLDLYVIDILTKPTHVVAEQRIRKTTDPVHLDLKKNFSIQIINQLNSDTLGTIRFHKKTGSFEITDYIDSFKFVIEK